MYILTNGQAYISQRETGGLVGTTKQDEALRFESVEDALKAKSRAPKRTKNYNVVDEDTYEAVVIKKTNTKSKRKSFSKATKKFLYDKANRTCQLCGRKLTFKEMTVDHIVPLAKNGTNDIANLQCACKMCNRFKDSILPEDFLPRITEIFIYQMNKNYGNSHRWKIIRGILRGIANEN